MKGKWKHESSGIGQSFVQCTFLEEFRKFSFPGEYRAAGQRERFSVCCHQESPREEEGSNVSAFLFLIVFINALSLELKICVTSH